jgi:hypothetical protein
MKKREKNEKEEMNLNPVALSPHLKLMWNALTILKHQLRTTHSSLPSD